jgi:uncharacterized protein
MKAKGVPLARITLSASYTTWLRPLRRPAQFVAFAMVLLLIWLASGLATPIALSQASARLQGSVTIFLGIFIEALPFLLAGVLASSAIHLFVPPSAIQRLSPRNPLLAAVTGALLGLVFPVCECGSVPTTRRLLTKGAPLPLGIAFSLAAPAVNPIVIISTWVAFGRLDIVLARIGLTILIAVATGFILGHHARPQELLARGVVIAPPQWARTLRGRDKLSKRRANDTTQLEGHQHGTTCQHDHDHAHDHVASGGRLRQLLNHAGGEFFEMGRYLVIGGLIAATLQTVVPRSALLALGQGPVVSVVALMLLAVVLSICSTVDAFIALAFVSSFMPGAVLAFLVFGPMIDVKSILMFSSTFRPRTVVLMTLLTFQMVLLAGLIINLYL